MRVDIKNAITLFFAVALVSVLAACVLFPENPTINGTVTITLDGIPWNTDNFPLNEYAVSTGEVLSRAPAPPRDRPYIRASTPFWWGGRDQIGGVYADRYQHTDDLAKGTYKWSMNIPADRLPCLVYFQINKYESDGIWINKEDTTIDLGIIDFKTLRLSGNLPVTINGEPLDYEYSQVAKLYIFYPNTAEYEEGRSIISPNGDWSLYAIVPDSFQPLRFRVLAEKNGGTFTQDLIPGEVITIHDTESDTVKEVIFPSHPSIDFKAFNISGTYKLLFNDPKKILYSSGTAFYEKPEAISGEWIAHSYKDNPLSDDNGLIHWETMIPAFSFPHNLPCKVSALLLKGNTIDMVDINGKIIIGKVTPSNVVITITEDTDLNNIHLGSFTVE